MAWRSWDRPLVGTIFRLPDVTSLVRGVTFTILPDGRSIEVPAMNRVDVRAHSNRHDADDDDDITQALHNLLHGKKPGDVFRDDAGRHRRADRGRVGDPLDQRVGIRGAPARNQHVQQVVQAEM